MTNEMLIIQAQAAVNGTAMLLKAGRATEEELRKAKRRLAELQAIPETEDPAPVISRPDPPQGRKLDQDEYNRIQADLSAEADQLNRQMAELSNQLHLTDPALPVPDLTRSILDIKDRIETIWDKKRYLERNGCLPDDPAPVRAAPVVVSQQKMAYAYEKRRYIDKRSKLLRKLDDPRGSEKKRIAWQTELVQVNLRIDELTTLIEAL